MADQRPETTEAPGSKPARTRKRLLIGGGIALLLGAVLVLVGASRYPLNRVVAYDDPAEHYKYGSIGSDIENGLPLHVMEVLPAMFPEYLPPGAPHDWTAFGFIQEPGHSMPIGFSERQRIVPRTGLTCAACHTGTWRAAPDAEDMMILGMPAVTLDLQAFFMFLFRAAEDPRFTTENVLAAMEEGGREVGFTDRLVYRFIVPGMRERLLARKAMVRQLFYGDHPPFGPGRVDTFNPYKVNQLAEHYPDGIPEEELIGTADFPAIWNQGIREGWQLNWDGNSPTIHDRNMGAAFGAGATREGLDIASIDRVTEYLGTLPAPRYPLAVDEGQVAQGRALFRQHCFACHDPEGDRIGTVTPLEEINTDPYRLNSYTERLNQLLLDYGEGYEWRLTSMVKTNGYANAPLDGIWARAPYLHNGSVPSLWDLLTPAEQRNGGAASFFTGHGVYDSTRVGFRTDLAEVEGRPSYRFDLTLPGNSNEGHTGVYYGTELSDEEKQALIEYMKTL